MPGPPHTLDGLTAQKRKACRLDATGMPAGEIAREVGCEPSTFSRWRKDPAYIALLKELTDKLDQEMLREARMLRREAMGGLRKVIRRANDDLDNDELEAKDVASYGRLLLGAYETLAGQTGVGQDDGKAAGVTFTIVPPPENC